MLYASAVNVVAITLIAAIAGISRLSWCWLPARIAPPPARNSSGSRKLKNAALGWRPDREDPPVLDDRDAVGELLRLVEVVRRQQDRLAEIAQVADRLPRAAPGLRIKAGRRLVEEDQLGVADEREREVQPPQL